MKKPITKAQIRKQIDQQISSYLTKGGDVEQVPRGISGRNPGDPPLKPNNSFFSQPKENRTYLNEVVATLDLRRQQKNQPLKPAKSKQSRMVKKIIYDDFGEALRWKWEEET